MTGIITDRAMEFLESLTMSLDVSMITVQKGHGDVFRIQQKVCEFKVYLERFEIYGMLPDKDIRSLVQQSMTFSGVDGFFNVANLVKARGLLQLKVDCHKAAAKPGTCSKLEVNISGGVSLDESIDIDELLQITPFTQDLPTINPFSINIDRDRQGNSLVTS